jgi:hypothetical protein
MSVTVRRRHRALVAGQNSTAHADVRASGQPTRRCQRPVLGDEAAGMAEPMSAGAGDAEEISFRVGEVADDEAAR